MKKKIIFLLGVILFSNQGWSFITFGGYVPFGYSTQKENDGSRNALSFDPALAFNNVIPFSTPFSQVFLPEFGFVFHGSNDSDDYSKRTTYILLDLGYLLVPKLVLRYGLGTFITKIKGKGGSTSLRNGSATTTFYRPGKETSSWNTTLNLGAEMAVYSNWAPRFELFLFSPLSSTARKVSYLLSLTYYL